MIEEVESRSLGEQLDMEITQDGISKCRELRITYTRALLLKFSGVEVCRKLPGDFNLLISSEQNGAATSMVEDKKMGALPSFKWDIIPGKRWDINTLMPNKVNHSSSDVVFQKLPHESGYDTMVLDQKTNNSGPCQLKKSENPYRPPHFNKKVQQSSDSFSELTVESSESSSFSEVESDQRGLADSVTEIDKTVEGSPFPSVNDKESETIGANEKLPELETIDDNQPTFEVFWADILESLRLQEEDELKSTHTLNSEFEIRLPADDSLFSVVDHSIIPKTLDFNEPDNSNDAADSDDEIIWPDEDSLISVYDMLGPPSPMPTLDRNFLEKSNTEVDIRMKAEFPFFRLGSDDMNCVTKPNYISYMPALNCYTSPDFLYPSCFADTGTNDYIAQYSLFQQPNIGRKQQNRLIDMTCHHPVKQVAKKDFNATHYFT